MNRKNITLFLAVFTLGALPLAQGMKIPESAKQSMRIILEAKNKDMPVSEQLVTMQIRHFHKIPAQKPISSINTIFSNKPESWLLKYLSEGYFIFNQFKNKTDDGINWKTIENFYKKIFASKTKIVKPRITELCVGGASLLFLGGLTGWVAHSLWNSK